METSEILNLGVTYKNTRSSLLNFKTFASYLNRLSDDSAKFFSVLGVLRKLPISSQIPYKRISWVTNTNSAWRKKNQHANTPDQY